MFREFLKSEFSEENIEFWLACEDYKKTKTDHLHGKAERIYEEFVQSDAIKQVCSKSICAVAEGEGVASLRCSHTQLHKRKTQTRFQDPSCIIAVCSVTLSDLTKSHRMQANTGRDTSRAQQRPQQLST